MTRGQLSTGDELIAPGEPIQCHQLRRSNPQGLAAALTLAGFAPLTDRHLPDRRDELLGVLGELLAQHEVLVLSGGVSAGRYDYVPGVLSELGVECVFHKVAQRPGGPMWFGVNASGRAVFALPGNPVSVLVCLGRYVIPALHAATGSTLMPPRQVATLKVRDQPGWITFSIDGRHAWPSTGEVFDVKSRTLIATLEDEVGRQIGSEKLLEVVINGTTVTRVGDQFGVGRVIGRR